MKTKVIFRKWEKTQGGGTIALFPQDAGSVGKPWTCLSYEHIGQHGSADVALMRTTLPAKPSEYRELEKSFAELATTCKS